MAFDFTFPDVGEGISSGEIVQWLVKEGDTVKEDQPLVKVETDKAVVELPSPKAGRIERINAKAGATVKVGQVLVTIAAAGEAPAKAKAGAAAQPPAAEEAAEERPRIVGVVGRFEEAKAGESVFERAKSKARQAAPPAAAAAAPVVREPEVQQQEKREPAPEKPGPEPVIKKKYDLYGKIERVVFKGVRKSTAKLVAKSHATAVHVTHTDMADVTALVELHGREKAAAEKKGTHLTYLPYVVKACIEALKKHPSLNASLDEEAEEIILKQYYNIGIAVSTPEGLFVPVIKGADQKDRLAIAKEIETLSGKVKERSIDLMDLKGGTFSITNIGSAGGLFATPIINYPEAAILGLGKIRKMPVVRSANGKDTIEVRQVLPLSLSFDHRIIDGAEAALFTNDIISLLEKPESIPR